MGKSCFAEVIYCFLHDLDRVKLSGINYNNENDAEYQFVNILFDERHYFFKGFHVCSFQLTDFTDIIFGKDTKT